MKYKSRTYFILGVIILISFIIKLVLILEYKNRLTLSSDDLNYVKSAVVLIKRGIYTFHNLNEPTVFVTPTYPFFIASVFSFFGYGLQGMQAVRIIQAVISCVTILLTYLIAKELFNEKVGLLASFFVAFYIPNIITVGFVLTETLFSMLLHLLIYLSLSIAKKPDKFRFAVLGILWAVTTLCRPTIALYPVMLFIYLFWEKRFKIIEIVKTGSIMFIAFAVIMSPWWIRNYLEYGEFIPLAASSGNPFLQGTYVNYEQTPENIVFYKLGKNAFETNKTEVEVAKMRIKQEFKKDFLRYLKWYTVDKAWLLWGTVFYWKQFFGISSKFVIFTHYVLIYSSILGTLFVFFKRIKKYSLIIMLLLYYTVVHCVYMAFDRYAFPLIPLVAILSSFFFTTVLSTALSKVKKTVSAK
ncbi:MAG TPA: glycosyltransferase family 39 protein [Acetivibrio sp.]|nr:glycosyltransferase family 39 protein [Acetivibrio sp.]HPT90448.1 glycosyltransferase family 39 protein [Acetivibrio sp.]